MRKFIFVMMALAGLLNFAFAFELSAQKELEYGLEASYYQDLARAAKHFESACNKGSINGCSFLGISYYNGEGVRQDYKKAIEIWQMTCDKKDAVGCAQLGHAYSSGKAVKQDYKKAMELYQKACDLGGADACYDVASLYLEAKGVE